MTTRISKLLLAGVAVLALSACDRIRNVGEAGRFLDEGNFGNPTMHNYLIQTGQLSYAESLAARFAEEVPTTINFAFDSAVLDSNARAVLSQQAQWILRFPEVQFSVYGHTDLVGSDAYNQGLGRRRAQAAVNFLVSQGIERSRLHALVSLGERQPLVPTESREVRNRRTVTEVAGFVQNHPTVLDGRYADIVYRSYGGPRTSSE